MNRTYNPSTPYAILMTGRPEEPESHRAIAVYSKEEYEQFRKKWVETLEGIHRIV